MYTPIQATNITRKSSVSTMAVKGENTRSLPQLLDTGNALAIENYFIRDDGQLEKRDGHTTLHNASATYPITMVESFTSSYLMYTYNKTLARYDIVNDTSTDIKTDFTTDDVFSGVKYGNYFIASNGGDKIGFTHLTASFINCVSKSAAFTEGETITGGTSGATATISGQYGATDGLLILDDIVGTFTDTETITGGTSSTTATIDGATYSWYEINEAPKAKVLRIINGRLYAGNTDTDSTEVRFSAVDDGTNPPFMDWTNASGAADPGKINYRNAGEVKGIASLGSQIVVLSEDGKFGFRIETVDVGGTLIQDNPTDFQRIDFGSERGVAVTPKGVFYANEAGIWQMTSGGQTNIPYSDSEGEISMVYSEDDIDDISFTNSDIIYDIKNDCVYVACAKNSSVNNIIKVYHLESKAWTTFTGMSISRFANKGSTIYGGDSSIAKLYELFKGKDDDGNTIDTKFYQEVSVGALWTVKELTQLYVSGRLSPASSIDITFDIFDEKGQFKEKKVFNSDTDTLTWTSTGIISSGIGGVGTTWGSSYGGSSTATDVSDSFSGGAVHIANFQRIRIKFKSGDKSDHTLNWFSMETREKQAISRRNLITKT